MRTHHFFNQDIYKVAIVGPGAVGGFFAKLYSEGGAQVSLLGKENSQHLSHLSTHGLTIETSDGNTTKISKDKFSYIGTLNNFPKNQIQDLVIICVKQYEFTANVAQRVREITNEKSVIAVVTNGIPFYFLWGKNLPNNYLNSIDKNGQIQQQFKNRIIIGLQIVIASQLISSVVHIKRPLSQITITLGTPGSLDSYIANKLSQIKQFLDNKGHTTTIASSSDLSKNILEKLQFAISINTLSAIMEKNIGYIFENPDCQTLIQYIIKVLNCVAIALEIPPLRNYEEFKKIKITKQHFSSLYQDMQAGKPGEIDAILAAPIELIRLLQRLEFAAVKNITVEPLLLLESLLIKKFHQEIISPQDLPILFERCNFALSLLEQNHTQLLRANL